MRWLTDLHLDRGSPAARVEVLASLSTSSARSPLILTGDLSHAASLADDLQALATTTGGQLYFVLGNHDHYGSSVAAVRDQVIALEARAPTIRWLPRAGAVMLDATTALVGVDGWADGRFGEPLSTPLRLNDDRLIAELAGQSSRAARLEVKRILADADAARLSALLDEAYASDARTILVATHVPPFVEALPPGSRAAHPDWYPLLVCGATGEALRRFAKTHSSVRLRVLAGHSHAAHDANVLPNLRVTVGRPRQLVEFSP